MKTIKFLFLSVITLSIFYSGSWFGLSYFMNRYIEEFYYEDGPKMGVTFYSKKPKISGFPFKPVISYRSGFEYKGTKFSFKEMTLTGFPIPYFPMALDIKENIVLNSKKIKQQVKFDEINLAIIAPRSIPDQSDRQTIKQWQRKIGKIKVTHFRLKSNNVDIYGDGYIGLDRKLQPEMALTSHVSGYELMVTELIEQGAVKPVVGAVTLSALKNLEMLDEASGKKVVEFNVIIEDRQLSVGPLKIIEFPRVVWF